MCELREQAFFARHAHGDMVLVDIGANMGLYTTVSVHYLDAGSS